MALIISGMEGSPVFNEHAQFVGLLTRPLRQKVSGTEVQVWEGCSLSLFKFTQCLKVEDHA